MRMPANKIAVIETRLPYTDRRALSEAWFSALHLSHETPHAGAAARHSAAAAVSIGDPKQRRAPDRATHATTRRDPARGLTHAARRAAFAGLDVPLRRSTDVRAATSAASAAFDRARSYPPFRTSLTLEGANGTRVHLIVRRVGATLHVVALCPPAVEHLVRRALASADLHFRACGERLQVDVNKSEARA
jgi:hypothetical protein